MTAFDKRCPSRKRTAWLTGAAMASAAAIPLCTASGTSAWGDNINWAGQPGSSWFDKSNWSTNAVPSQDDSAYIYAPGPLIDKAGVVNGLTVSGQNGSVTIGAGATFEARDHAVIGSGLNNVGAVTITGRGAIFKTPTALSIGQLGGVGKVSISNGGKVFSLDTSIRQSSLTVTGKNSEFRADRFFKIYNSKLTVSDGGSLWLAGNWGQPAHLQANDNSTIFVGAGSTNPENAIAPGYIKAEKILFGGLGQSQLNFNHTDNSRKYEFTPALSGNGILNLYNGATVLTANSVDFVGPTNVHEKGTLIVKGSIANSDVMLWGILAGNGKVKSVTVKGGGKVEPGNSVGTIHIGGDFTMDPGSVYRAEINGDRSDLIEVGGAANILSGTIEILRDKDSASPILPGKRYTLITAAGGLTGGTPQHAIADFPFLNLTLSSDANNGYLTLSRNSGAFAELATTPNEKAVANVLDGAGTANPLWQQVVGAGEAQARAAFTSLGSASIHANAAGVLSAQSHYLRDAVINRSRQDLGIGGALAPAGSVVAFAEGTPREAYAASAFSRFSAAPPAVAPGPVYAVWAQGLGSRGTLKGDGNAASTDHSLGGIISGVDVTLNGMWRVGLAGGYSQSSFKSPSLAASGSSDSYHVALYGGGQVGGWGLRGGASFSWNDITTLRQVVVVNLAGQQRGDYAAKTTQVFGEVGHSFAFATGALEPFANIAYVGVNGGVSELGNAAVTALMHFDTTYTTLGLRGATALTSTLTARGTLGWRHALGGITPVAALAFQSGGAAFTLAGSPIARDALVAESGLDFAVAANISLGVSWTGQFADKAYDNTVKGNFTWRF